MAEGEADDTVLRVFVEAVVDPEQVKEAVTQGGKSIKVPVDPELAADAKLSQRGKLKAAVDFQFEGLPAAIQKALNGHKFQIELDVEFIRRQISAALGGDFKLNVGDTTLASGAAPGQAAATHTAPAQQAAQATQSVTREFSKALTGVFSRIQADQKAGLTEAVNALHIVARKVGTTTAGPKADVLDKLADVIGTFGEFEVNHPERFGARAADIAPNSSPAILTKLASEVLANRGTEGFLSDFQATMRQQPQPVAVTPQSAKVVGQAVAAEPKTPAAARPEAIEAKRSELLAGLGAPGAGIEATAKRLADALVARAANEPRAKAGPESGGQISTGPNRGVGFRVGSREQAEAEGFPFATDQIAFGTPPGQSFALRRERFVSAIAGVRAGRPVIDPDTDEPLVALTQEHALKSLRARMSALKPDEVVESGLFSSRDPGAGSTRDRSQRGTPPPFQSVTGEPDARLSGMGRGGELAPPPGTVVENDPGRKRLEKFVTSMRERGKIIGGSLSRAERRAQPESAALGDFAQRMAEALASAAEARGEEPGGVSRAPNTEDFLALAKAGVFDSMLKRTFREEAKTKTGKSTFTQKSAIEDFETNSPLGRALGGGKQVPLGEGTVVQRLTNADVQQIAELIFPGGGITEEQIGSRRTAYRGSIMPGQSLAPGVGGGMHTFAGQRAANASMLAGEEWASTHELSPEERQMAKANQIKLNEENRARIAAGEGLELQDLLSQENREGRTEALGITANLTGAFSKGGMAAATTRVAGFNRFEAVSNEAKNKIAADETRRAGLKNPPPKLPTTVYEVIQEETEKLLSSGGGYEDLPEQDIASLRSYIKNALSQVADPAMAETAMPRKANAPRRRRKTYREADAKRGENLREYGIPRGNQLAEEQRRLRAGQAYANLAPGSRAFLETEAKRQGMQEPTDIDTAIDVERSRQAVLAGNFTRLAAAHQGAPDPETGVLKFPAIENRTAFEAAKATAVAASKEPYGGPSLEELLEARQAAGAEPGVYPDLGKPVRGAPTGDEVRMAASRIGLGGLSRRRGRTGAGTVAGGAGGAGAGGVPGQAGPPTPPTDNRPSIGGPFDVRVINFQDLAGMLNRNLGPEVAGQAGPTGKRRKNIIGDGAAVGDVQTTRQRNQSGRIALSDDRGPAELVPQTFANQPRGNTAGLIRPIRPVVSGQARHIMQLEAAEAKADKEAAAQVAREDKAAVLAARQAKAEQARQSREARKTARISDPVGFGEQQDLSQDELTPIRSKLRRAQRFTPRRGFGASITDAVTAALGRGAFESQLEATGRAEQEATELAGLFGQRSRARSEKAGLVSQLNATPVKESERRQFLTESIAKVDKNLIGLGQAIDISKANFLKNAEAATKASTVLKSFGAAAVGGAVSAAAGSVTFGLGLAITGPLIQAISEGLAQGLGPAIERATGFGATTSRVTSELAGAVQAAGGRPEAVAGAVAPSGISAETFARLGPTLIDAAQIEQGNKALQVQLDLLHTFENLSKRGAQAGLTQTLGGFLGTEIFGTPPTTQQIAGELKTETRTEVPAPIAPSGAIVPGAVSDMLGGLLPAGQAVEPFGAGQQVPLATTETFLTAEGRDALKGFNDQAKKGGTALRLLEDHAQGAATRVEATAKAFDKIGANDLADRIRDASLSIAGIEKVSADEAADMARRFAGGVNRGSQRPSAALLLEAQGPQLQAQFATEDAQLQLRNQTLGPASRGIRNTLAPLGDITKPLKALGITDLGELPGLLSQISKEAAAGAAQATGIVTERLGTTAGKEFSADLKLAAGYATQISDLQIDVQTAQATYQAHQYSEQLRVAERSLENAKALAGQVADAHKGALGTIQRETYELQRQSQSLSLGMSQRQLNFQTAVAGFEVPGLTPEEQAARVKEQKLETDYAQKQLDIQKKLFGLSGRGFEITADQNVQDIANQVRLLGEGREVTLKTAKIEGQIKVLNKQLEGPVERINNTWDLAQKRALDITGLIAGLASITGEALNDVTKQVFKVLETYYKGLMATIGGYTLAPDRNPNLPSEDQPHAMGMVGLTTGATSLGYAGEAGTEAVAIIKNPRPITGNFNGGGGGTVQINIDARGATIDEAALSNWKREIVREVAKSMGTTASLVGARLS